MRRILTYKLFESDIFNKISDVNEKEVETKLTDICTEFTDDYILDINFRWGWAVPDKRRKTRVPVYPHGELIDYWEYREDSHIKIFQKDGGEMELTKKYLQETQDKGKRYVEISFTAPFGSQKLNIYKPTIKEDFENLVDLTKRHFSDEIVGDMSENINPDIWTIRFYIIFK